MSQQSKDTSLSLSKLLVLLIGLAFVSCDSSEPNLSDGFIGKWKWEASFGGRNGIYIPADSFGYTEHIVFENSYDVSIYRNDSLKVKAKYQIDAPYSNTKSRRLTIKNEVYLDTNFFDPIFLDIGIYKYTVLFGERDSLIFNVESCADCYYQLLLRER